MTPRERLQKWAGQHSDVTPLDGTDRNSPTFGDLRTLLANFALGAVTNQIALPEGIAHIAITFANQRTAHPLASDIRLDLPVLPAKARRELSIALQRVEAAHGMAITEQPLAKRKAQLCSASNALARAGALIAAAIERTHHEIALIEAMTFEVTTPSDLAGESEAA